MQIYCPNCQKYSTITSGDLPTDSIYVNCPDCKSKLYIGRFAAPIATIAGNVKKAQLLIQKSLFSKTGTDVSLGCRIVYIPICAIGVLADIETYKDNVKNITKISPIYAEPFIDTIPAEYEYAFPKLKENIQNTLHTNLEGQQWLTLAQLEKTYDYAVTSILAPTKDYVSDVMRRMNILNILNEKYLDSVPQDCSSASLNINKLEYQITYKPVYELLANILSTEYSAIIDPFFPAIFYNNNFTKIPNVPLVWNA